jgi:hypothetical protein
MSPHNSATPSNEAKPKAGAPISTCAVDKPKTSPPAPKPSPQGEWPEPDALMFKQAQKKRRLLELKLMDGSELVEELITWGRFSVVVDVTDGSALTDHFEGGRQLISKHAIARMRLGEGVPQRAPESSQDVTIEEIRAERRAL